jgi:N-sulfoglucosamine sulfohydrolase
MKTDKVISLKARFILLGISLFILFNFGCVKYQNEDSKSASNREGERPNILMLVSEDHGPELGIFGDPFARTPVLDRLGAEGVVFERAYATQAGCSPSRASIMTGLYPHQNGQIGLATHGFRLYNDDEMLLLPNALKQAGYRTGIVGKLHVNPEPDFEFDMRLDSDSFNERDVRMVADNAMRFLNETDHDKPFFLSVNYADVHRPYIGDFIKQANGLPENPHMPGDVDILPHIGFYEEMHAEKAANYYNSIERLDAGIGILLDQMIESGDLENTIIIYFSDHGSDKFRGKTTIYEGGTKVPLIIHWGDHIETGQRRDELVSINDFVPTLLELAGVNVPEILPGRSLLPLLQNRQTEWREYLFTEYHIHSPHNLYPQRAVRNDRFKLIHNLHNGKFNPGYAWRFNIMYGDEHQNGRQYIENILAQAPLRIRNTYANLEKAPEYELYDLANDPNEFNNLADNESFRGIKEHLIAALHDWQVRTKDPLLDDENLRLLEYEVHGTFDNREYLVGDDNGNMVVGKYNRVRWGDDYWRFYGQWKSFMESL